MSWLIGIIGVVASIWIFLAYIITVTIRIDSRTFKIIYDEIKNNDRKFIISEEIVSNLNYPIEYKAILFIENCPWFFLNRSERLLNAGFKDKDNVSTITCFRFSYNEIKTIIGNLRKSCLGIPVEVIMPRSTDMVGVIRYEVPEPALHPRYWKDIEKDAAEVFSGVREKSGALLYGPPGNNKTFFVKYLARKYRVPIKIVSFSPDFDNLDIMFMFSQINSRCIVLFEDFDNYFYRRDCLFGSENIKFTFDSILNGLDGVYGNYRNVFFVMTVNNIDSVDTALKNRPSRFKFLRKFDNPDLETRSKILPKEWAENSEGMNLDQIFRLKNFYENGLSLREAKNNLIEVDKLESLAYQLYQDRLSSGISGTAEDDWLLAESILLK